MVYFFLRHTVFPLIRLLFIREITGFENLPRTEPYILTSNHASYGDATLLLAALLPAINRRIHFVAWKKLATILPLKLLLTYFGSVFENGSIDKLIILLQKGELVAIYPEGGRTHDGRIQPVKNTGLGVMAALTGAPVIPLHTIGAFDWWPYSRLLPHFTKTISIRIGKPLYFTGSKNRTGYLAFGNRVMETIKKL